MPPEKKTRCTNQNAPASITMMEPANASRRPAASLRDRIQMNSDATSTTNDELTNLDADVEREQRPAERAAGQIHLAKHVREPEAVDQAERKRDPRARVAPAGADEQIVRARRRRC